MKMHRPRAEPRLSREAEQSLREIMKKSVDISRFKDSSPIREEESSPPPAPSAAVQSPPAELSPREIASSPSPKDIFPPLGEAIRDDTDFISMAVSKQVDRTIEQEKREIRLKSRKKNKYGEVKSKVALYFNSGRTSKT